MINLLKIRPECIDEEIMAEDHALRIRLAVNG